MNLLAILKNIGLPDVLDILVISIISYQLYVWFWGTKAFKALAGIVLLSGIFLIAKSWGLFLTTWVFQILWQVFVILLIILFQKEIRLMLERFNPLKRVGFRQAISPGDWIPGFSAWAFDAGKRRMGALVVFERNDLVFDLVTKGTALECVPRPEILNSIFHKFSPLHDGAILISHGKMLKAACYLPLSSREDLPQEWGTRHRAAFGLTEQCDAWVLIVSEERGHISLVSDQTVRRIENENELSALLEKEMFESREPETGIREKIRSWFTRRYQIKAAVFGLVFTVWLVFAGQQNFEKRIDLPVHFENLPAGLVVSEPMTRTVSVTCRGLRKDVSSLNGNNVRTAINLDTVSEGGYSFDITPANLTLPNNRVDIITITPARIDVIISKKPVPESRPVPKSEN